MGGTRTIERRLDERVLAAHPSAVGELWALRPDVAGYVQTTPPLGETVVVESNA